MSPPESGPPTLTDHAARWAAVAAANVRRPYPYAPARLLRGPQDLTEPRERHPAFHGSYDWHSAVHMHWLQVRLLRRAAGHRDPATAPARTRTASTPARSATPSTPI